eukprot:5549255-Amphidinium_carterae.1
MSWKLNTTIITPSCIIQTQIDLACSLVSELTVLVVIAESPKVYDLKDMPFKLVAIGQTTASLKSVLVVKLIGPDDDKPDLDAARELFLAE